MGFLGGVFELGRRWLDLRNLHGGRGTRARVIQQYRLALSGELRCGRQSHRVHGVGVGGPLLRSFVQFGGLILQLADLVRPGRLGQLYEWRWCLDLWLWLESSRQDSTLVEVGWQGFRVLLVGAGRHDELRLLFFLLRYLRLGFFLLRFRGDVLLLFSRRGGVPVRAGEGDGQRRRRRVGFRRRLEGEAPRHDRGHENEQPRQARADDGWEAEEHGGEVGARGASDRGRRGGALDRAQQTCEGERHQRDGEDLAEGAVNATLQEPDRADERHGREHDDAGCRSQEVRQDPTLVGAGLHPGLDQCDDRDEEQRHREVGVSGVLFHVLLV